MFIIIPSVIDQFSDKDEYQLTIYISAKTNCTKFEDISIGIYDNKRKFIYKNYYYDNSPERSEIDSNLLTKFIDSIKGEFTEDNPNISFGLYQEYIEIVDEKTSKDGDIGYINGDYNIYVKIINVGTITHLMMKS